MRKQYFFENVNDLIGYLKQKLDPFVEPKLQQTLYLLWGYYSGFYSELNNYPKQLFSAKFEPTIYGTISKIQNKECCSSSNNLVFENEMQKDVKQFIDDLLKQINELSVFSLANRIHQDKAYQVAFKNKESLNNNLIIREYKKKSKE